MQIKRLTIISICCVLLLINQEVKAQQPLLFEQVSIAQGLSQGMVFDILQDKEGFIWVATKNGLNRYDGYQFQVFTNDPYNPSSLSGNTVLTLMEDAKGFIWVGTDNNGVNIYDKKKGTFYRLQQGNQPGSISSNNIKTMLELNDGRFLIGTVNAGLNIVTLGDRFFTNADKANVTRLQLPNNTQLYGMGKDAMGRIWVGGMNGAVYQLNEKLNSFAILPNAKLYNSGHYNADGSLLANNRLFLARPQQPAIPLFDTGLFPPGNLLLNPKGDMWDNIHREPYFYDIALWNPGKVPNFSETLPIDTSKRICYPFIIDRSTILWSGSLGYGLRKYYNSDNRFSTLVAGQSSRRIVPISNNEIIWADFSYQGFSLKDGNNSNGVFKKMIPITEVDNFIISSANDYWIKSDNSGYHKYKPSNNTLKSYPAINPGQVFGNKQPFMEDSSGNIWFPGENGMMSLMNVATEKLVQFNINTNAAKVLVTHLYEDKQGVVWVSTETGLAKLVFTNGIENPPAIKWFYNENSTRNSLNYNHVSCCIDDPKAPDQYLWIATKGGGLNRLNKKDDSFEHFTTKNGLPDDVVYGILSDEEGNLWGSTNKGLFCMMGDEQKKDNWHFRYFTKADGLQDDEFNTGAFAKLPNGQLVFGGVNGINIFEPKAIMAANFTPNVFITNLYVNNQPVTAGDASGVLKKTVEQSDKIELTYLQDILTLEFASLDFTSPAQNKYRYQLIGIDKEWIESGSRRSATYLHLPAGNYIFRLQGSNSQGVWSNKVVELKITVNPPWWRTWWAYGMYLVLLGLAIRAYFKFRLNKAKLQSALHFEQEEAKRIKELDTVKTQLYANITHEFRTPLTVILGMAQQVKSNPNEHLENGVDMIVRNGQNLLNLVNEMLDLSKLEDGKMTLHLVSGNVIHFLRYVVESFQSLAESQQKQFHFLSDTDELYVSYDAEKLRQIITNLLSNALKFTEANGNVYVSISQEAAADHHTILVLKIKDTGIGIPTDQLAHIFDRFYQLDNSHTRNAEGTGIGLALTKELVRLMNGTIAVKSPAVGASKGTEFTIHLPLQQQNTKEDSREVHSLPSLAKSILAPPLQEPSFLNIDNSSTPLILLVEDNVDVVAYTASCLPQYRLAVGKDGKEGLEIALELIPDLIVSDVMMPLIDGFEMCKKLRADVRTSHIPIIMLTAKADMQSKLAGLEHGADAYLEKPFHKAELLLRIKKLLEGRKNLQLYYSKQMGIVQTEEVLGDKDVNAITVEAPAEHEFVKKVREITEANFTNYDFSVEQLCRLIFMSHSQLHRKLEALTGCSPNKFIRLVRLRKAKEMLLNPSFSIAIIAQECGYNDPGYFARVFKQEFGATPQEWRVGQ